LLPDGDSCSQNIGGKLLIRSYFSEELATSRNT
jgi:hypothetical protein